MKPLSRSSVLLACWAKGLLLSASLVGGAVAEERLKSVDRQVPQFALSSVSNESWQASSLEGKVWVVNFWATWCPPCVEEIPSMNKAWAVLEEHGIGMLAVNAGESGEAVDTFLKKIPIDFPTLLGDANSLPNWSIKVLPTTIVIDSTGKVVFEALGPREWDDEQLLEKIIGLL